MAHAIARFAPVPILLACAASAHGQLIYVSDDWADRVAIFDATTGEYKSDLIEFMYASWLISPQGLLVRAHDVLIASYSSGDVYSIDRTTGTVSYFVEARINVFDYPMFILERLNGDLFIIASAPPGPVMKYDREGASQGPLLAWGAASGWLGSPQGMALANGVLYVAQSDGAVKSYNSDTGEFLGTIVGPSGAPGYRLTSGIAVAPNGDLYVGAENAVRRVDLTYNVVVAVIPIPSPRGIEIDPGTGDIIVSSNANLYRINKRTNTVSGPLLTGGGLWSIGFFRYVPAPACPGDITGDDQTDLADFAILAGSFGRSVRGGTSGDLNADALVNVLDFNILASNFGCGALEFGHGD